MAEQQIYFRIEGDANGIKQAMAEAEAAYKRLVNDLTRKQADIGALRAAQEGLARTTAALEEAKRKLEFFKRSAEIGGSAGAKAFAADIKRASAEVSKLSALAATQKTAVTGLTQSLTAAGINTRTLATENARLAAQIGGANITLNTRRQALQQLQADSGAAAAATSRLGVDVSRLGLVLQALGGAAGAGAIVKLHDSMVLLQARLKLVSVDADAAKAAMSGISEIAAKAQAPIDGVGTAYVRLARTVRALGGTQQDALGLTEALALGMRVSGATAAETAGTMVQLSQAFQKGKLDGDEFRTVAESGGKAMDYLAEGLGTSHGKLIEMSQAGELTADKMLKAWTKMLPKIREDAAKIPQTVGGAFTELSNQFSLWVSNSASVEAVTRNMATAVGFLAAHMDELMGLGVAAGVLAMAVAFNKLRDALLAARLAGIAFAAANPWLLVIAAVAGAIVAFSDMGDAAEDSAGQQAQAADTVKQKYTELTDRLENLTKRRIEMEDRVARAAKAAMKDTYELGKKTVQEAIRDSEALRNALVSAWEASSKAAKDYSARAAELRGNIAARKNPKDSSVEGQALAILALLAAEGKLQRLRENGASLEDVQKQAEAVRKVAENIDDAARAQEALNRADEAEARALDKAAATEKERAAGLEEQRKANEDRLAIQKKSLAEIEQKLRDIAGLETNIKIQADQAALAQVKKDIAAVKSELDALPATKTITIKTVQAGSDGHGASGSFAHGGPVFGPGTGTSDSILARLSHNEHVLTAREVAMAGGHAEIYRLRSLIREGMLKRSLPGFADGGAVAVAAALSAKMPQRLPTTAGPASIVNLTLPGGGTFEMRASETVAQSLQKAVSRAALMHGRRR